MSSADMNRLRKAARTYSRGLLWEADDLLQEAITRALSQQRRCPRDVGVVQFLIWTIRSIASSDTKKPKRMERQSLSHEIEDPTPSAEERLGGQQEASRMTAAFTGLFPDDPTAQMIIEDTCQGFSPDETQRRAGLDRNSYASEMKKIRRRINKKYPKGWKP